MIAMITGAKRYILSPPNQCKKLGIYTQRQTPLYRHSLLNFGRYNNYHHHHNNKAEAAAAAAAEKKKKKTSTTSTTTTMTTEEEWFQIAGQAMAVETVLKQGEVLFIPSHWFHYIISLQKNAQCNVRSGVQVEGNPKFGGQHDIKPENCR